MMKNIKSFDFFAYLHADLCRFKSSELNDGDLRTNFFLWLRILSPRFYPVLNIRIAQLCFSRKFFRPLSYIFMWINVFLYGIECTPKCKIGPGLVLPHTVGTVIGAFSISSNVTIFQGVTLGAEKMDLGFSQFLRPCVGSDVILGAGAKILGGINIGDKCKVAPNSLVIKDVPSNAMVSGVPALIILAENT